MALDDHRVFIGNTVYRLTERNRLTPVQNLTVEDADAQLTSIAVFNDTAVLGFGDEGGTRGAVYVAQPGDHFGTALSIQGNVLAIGALGRVLQDLSCDITPSGLAYVFKERAGTWIEHQVIESPQQCTSAFGSAVAVNRYGLALGDQPARPAHFAQAYLYRNPGGQYVYETSTSGLESGTPNLVATRVTLYVGFPVEGLGIGGGVQFSPGEVQVFNIVRNDSGD